MCQVTEQKTAVEEAIAADEGSKGSETSKSASGSVTTVAGLDFISALSFEGARAGYVFRPGRLGMGYYKDGVEMIPVTATLEEEVASTADEVSQSRLSTSFQPEIMCAG